MSNITFNSISLRRGYTINNPKKRGGRRELRTNLGSFTFLNLFIFPKTLFKKGKRLHCRVKEHLLKPFECVTDGITSLALVNSRICKRPKLRSRIYLTKDSLKRRYKIKKQRKKKIRYTSNRHKL